jgi:hypothetical protein
MEIHLQRMADVLIELLHLLENEPSKAIAFVHARSPSPF